jgi:uncharacterized protein (TIGR03435 family)
MTHTLTASIAAILMAGTVFSTSPQVRTVSRPSFEVASIKPDDGRSGFYGFQSLPGGRLNAGDMTLKNLIAYAYRVRNYQVSGGPQWANTERWEIVAKAAEGSLTQNGPQSVFNPPDVVRLRLQSLLDDRFELRMHHETRQMDVYDLVIANGGSTVHLADDQTPFVPTAERPHAVPDAFAPGMPPLPPPPRPPPGLPLPPRPHGMIGILASATGNGFTLEASAVPVSNFIIVLSSQLGRPIIDKTGLKGLYDFKLQWFPDLAPPFASTGVPDTSEPLGPTIFLAIQQQLGLRLVSTKGPVDVIVIDGAERPKREGQLHVTVKR